MVWPTRKLLVCDLTLQLSCLYDGRINLLCGKIKLPSDDVFFFSVKTANMSFKLPETNLYHKKEHGKKLCERRKAFCQISFA